VYVLQKDDLSRWVSGREEERIGCLLQHGLEHTKKPDPIHCLDSNFQYACLTGRETGERGVYVLQKDDLSRWRSGREEERIG